MCRNLGLLVAFVAIHALSIPCVDAAYLASVDANAFDVESGHGNFDHQLGMTTASASYSNPEGGSAEAFATIGSSSKGALSLKVFATGSAGEVVSNRGSASLDWVDKIHTSGTLLDLLIDLKFQLTGSTSGDGRIGGSLNSCIKEACQEPLELTGPTTIHITLDELVSPSTPFDLLVNLHATASGTAIVGPASSTADFAHSLDLVEITARDANGNIVPGVTFVSESGFNYNAVVVPEPCTILLVSFASFHTLLQRRRRGGNKRRT